jgi:co-chaperonin GroES (HSP10)
VSRLVRFEPSPHRLIVRRADDVLDVHRSIIVAPDRAKDQDCALAGIVMAVGDMDPEIPALKLEVGDAVLFHVHEALEIKIDGEGYYILSMEGVLGRLPASDEPARPMGSFGAETR